MKFKGTEESYSACSEEISEQYGYGVLNSVSEIWHNRCEVVSKLVSSFSAISFRVVWVTSF